MPPPNLRVIPAPAQDSTQGRGPSVALIGSYPPRRCGIATFTADVFAALSAANPGLACDVYAMSDGEPPHTASPEVVCEIPQHDIQGYLDAADRINRTRPDVICVQHEFGIFGGSAGEHLMTLLDAVDRPVVSTLHTVLETPDPEQRRVFERLIARSARLVVMAERGRDILRRVWGVPGEKIVLIPHGAPDYPFGDTAPFKAPLDLQDREVLFTFGLLSPNKGIETVIRALPAILAERPKAIYVVLGATHPNLIAQEGERYRASVIELAAQLEVDQHLRLIDDYTDTARLIQYLQAADIYITPYLNPQQITSGTLSYAAALGKPIVSTPYWHAEELLAGGLGRLVPFGSPEAIATEVIGLLDDPASRIALGRSLYSATRGTVWACFGQAMLGAFEAAIKSAKRPQVAAPQSFPDITPSLGGVRRMTDGCGMLQHSVFSLPDRRHGYCVDDNARALMLMHRLDGPPDAERRALISTYAAFVEHAWNSDVGRFRNFMSYERVWLEPRGSEDSTGRSIWAVALTAATAHQADHRRWAGALMGQLLPRLDEIKAPRAEAFVLLGLCAMIEAGWREDRILAPARLKAQRLANLLRARKALGLPWFEDSLSYDNARLPEALIRAGRALEIKPLVTLGLEALDWLCRRQTDPMGNFLPVATADFGRPLQAHSLFDQQPVEVAATVDACEAAWSATQDNRWIAEAERAFCWYFGANTLGARIATGEGDCFDGLTWDGPNQNQGAESVLSLQLAACTLRRLTRVDGPRVKVVSDL